MHVSFVKIRGAPNFQTGPKTRNRGPDRVLMLQHRNLVFGSPQLPYYQLHTGSFQLGFVICSK
jgi:hypothetical protein